VVLCHGARPAMRTPYDQRNKEVLRDLFAPAGATGTDEEVAADAQRIDVWFVPDPGKASALAPLGMLGRLARTASAFEPFHRTPGVDEVLACVRKHLVWRQVLARRSSPGAGLAGEVPRMWIVSSGVPNDALREVGFRRARPTAGTYQLPAAFAVGLVVVSELPRTRDTLLLRLMGAGQTLRAAMADLAALPPVALEARVVIPHLLRLKLMLAASAADEDREFLMATEDLYVRWQREQRGQGALEVVQHQFERRLGRPLTASERETLLDQVLRLGTDRVGDVVLDLAPEQLAAWLAPRATQ